MLLHCGRQAGRRAMAAALTSQSRLSLYLARRDRLAPSLSKPTLASSVSACRRTVALPWVENREHPPALGLRAVRQWDPIEHAPSQLIVGVAHQIGWLNNLEHFGRLTG